MKITYSTLVVCLAVFSTPFADAAYPLLYSNPAEVRGFEFEEATDPVGKTGSGTSSSSSLPDAPEPNSGVESSLNSVRNSRGAKTHLSLRTAPFSAFAIGFSTGIDGLGVEVAMPLATRISLRGSASFLNYHPAITEDGIPIQGALKFRTLGAGVDIFPYHNSFHVTPGFVFYNGNQAGATAFIAPGSTFTINDTDYVSSPADPVRGVFTMDFGHRFAPSLTMGFGDMLRRDSHWSVPVDFGFEYIGTPKFTMNMVGTVCDVADGCTPIQSDPDTLSNLQQEQATINKDISPLRFYPILKVGLSYRFGHNVELNNWR